MPRVVHFEIHADDPDRAMRFYGDLFGWQFAPYFPDYWGIVTGEEGTPGINGGLVRRRGDRPTAGAPVGAYVCTVDVPDVDAYVERAQAAGGTIAVPKQPIAGLAWLAYCTDPEGNLFGMYQEDPTAA